MSQILIVEGNDAIVLSNLCKIRGIPPPTGYTEKQDFETKFVKPAGGFHKALVALEDVLNKLEYSNIGFIVDANNLVPRPANSS
jgi:hypothetical protein